MQISDSIDRVHSYILRHERHTAVFLVNGSPKCAQMFTDRARKQANDFPDSLIGVYTQDVDPRWLLDDLRYAERHMQ